MGRRNKESKFLSEPEQNLNLRAEDFSDDQAQTSHVKDEKRPEVQLGRNLSCDSTSASPAFRSVLPTPLALFTVLGFPTPPGAGRGGTGH